MFKNRPLDGSRHPTFLCCGISPKLCSSGISFVMSVFLTAQLMFHQRGHSILKTEPESTLWGHLMYFSIIKNTFCVYKFIVKLQPLSAHVSWHICYNTMISCERVLKCICHRWHSIPVICGIKTRCEILLRLRHRESDPAVSVTWGGGQPLKCNTQKELCILWVRASDFQF